VSGSSPSSSGGSAGASAVPTGTSTEGFITIQELPGLEAVAQVPSSSIFSVKQGESASISVGALGGQSFSGHVALIDPQGYNVSGQIYYNVTVVPNTGSPWPSQLLAGLPINVKIGG
jgi:multidrug efflux pump subunit AcrA (membrane-fusion protein)